MDKNEFKQIFFELLEDEEFKNKLQNFILDTVNEKISAAETVAETPAENADGEKLTALKSEDSELKKQLEELQRQLENLRREKSEVETDRNNLQEQLNALRREKSEIENDRNNLQGQLNTLRREKSEIENDRNNLQGQLNALRREKSEIENDRNNLQGQLEKRFNDGWKLYKLFLEIENQSLKESSGLYDETFESFICSGAQTKRLESIWDAVLDSKRNGNFDDAETFYNVFKYCVKLVNLAQGGKIIEILQTNEGEQYDTDKHSIAGNNCSTQGVVREIILTGYKNNISKKIVRKSNVRIGW